MKKLGLIILLFFLISPIVIAWDWKTHPRIVEKTIESLPIEIQEKINITLVIEGSIAPDKDFHDNVWHHYPPSYNKTLAWLNVTKIAWKKQDYNNASYAFGVASHYITDSFATPHYIEKEPSWLHTKFEKQPNDFEILTECSNKKINIQETLESESKKVYLWSEWLEDYNPEIPRQQVELATELMYSITLETFNAECTITTEIIEVKDPLKKAPKLPITILVIISLTTFIVIKKSNFFKY